MQEQGLTVKEKGQPANLLYVQKYTLQKRNTAGHFIQVGTYDSSPSPEEVEKEWGVGYFVLRSCKPRFETVWKRQLGSPDRRESQVEAKTHNASFQRLERKTNLLGLGVLATGVAEAVCLPLIHQRFIKLEDEIAQVKAVLGTFSASNLKCTNCRNNLGYMLESSCGSCGAEISWPKDPRMLQRPTQVIFLPNDQDHQGQMFNAEEQEEA